MTQPYALFIADILEDAGKPADIAEKAAATLRRLHAQRDELLKALKNIERSTYDTMTATLARVAITKTGEA